MNVLRFLESIVPGTKLRFCGPSNLVNLFPEEHPKECGDIVEVIGVIFIRGTTGTYNIKYSDGLTAAINIFMSKDYLPHDMGNMWWEVVIEIPKEELEL